MKNSGYMRKVLVKYKYDLLLSYSKSLVGLHLSLRVVTIARTSLTLSWATVILSSVYIII